MHAIADALGCRMGCEQEMKRYIQTYGHLRVPQVPNPSPLHTFATACPILTTCCVDAVSERGDGVSNARVAPFSFLNIALCNRYGMSGTEMMHDWMMEVWCWC